jgi:uncharacterized Ntn-hydrolase superfamily protein
MAFRWTELFSTYSIVARDPQTGELGVAVQTHQICVGARVPALLPNVGALASQSLANFKFGPMGLEMLAQGISAERVVAGLVATDEGANRRQLGVVDAQGRAAAWTGEGCIAHAGHQVGEGYTVQANMMTRNTVPAAMAKAYESTAGDLAARMLAALQAAQGEDGDIRGMQSAALVVVPGGADTLSWHYRYDLRVDEHAEPLRELARLVAIRAAQFLDAAGHEALEKGDLPAALECWQRARTASPDQEELPFWQAVTLADKVGDVATAAAILRPVLEGDSRRAEWIDLLRRLQACGLVERAGIAEALITAIG